MYTRKTGNLAKRRTVDTRFGSALGTTPKDNMTRQQQRRAAILEMKNGATLGKLRARDKAYRNRRRKGAGEVDYFEKRHTAIGGFKLYAQRKARYHAPVTSTEFDPASNAFVSTVAQKYATPCRLYA